MSLGAQNNLTTPLHTQVTRSAVMLRTVMSGATSTPRRLSGSTNRRGTGSSSRSDDLNRRSGGRGDQTRSGRRRQERTRRSFPVQKFDANFIDMHAKYGAPARYKVHRPGCACSKMKKLRERLEGQDAAIATDGLVVLPDTGAINSYYICSHTGEAVFEQDSKAAELKLREELFRDRIGGDDDDDDDDELSSYKVSCAVCLLRLEPNGFICVSSLSRQTVEFARDLALEAKRAKEQSGVELHADHAEYVSVVKRSILWQYEMAKTRDQKARACQALLDNLVKQGIDQEHVDATEIKLGHHLVSILHITRRDANNDSLYWLVMLQESSNNEYWVCDLPGGKRHLGEGAFESAIRETEEETSLVVDESWKVGDGEPRIGRREADQCNVYYTLSPPEDLLMQSLEKSHFWNQKGFCKEPGADQI